MGKGDHSISNTGPTQHSDNVPPSTIRSRHLSSNGLTYPPAPTLQLRKHRCPNGFSIPWFSQGKYAVTEKKAKDPLSWQLRSSAVLVILLLTNLINYMDRYTIAGLS